MGATNFENFASAREYSTPREAFYGLVKDAQWENGHGGYTGTIAEKDSWVMRNNGVPIPKDNRVRDFIYGMFRRLDGDIDANDKWGPAFCVPLCESDEDSTVIGWLFYGYASE